MSAADFSKACPGSIKGLGQRMSPHPADPATDSDERKALGSSIFNADGGEGEAPNRMDKKVFGMSRQYAALAVQNGRIIRHCARRRKNIGR